MNTTPTPTTPTPVKYPSLSNVDRVCLKSRIDDFASYANTLRSNLERLSAQFADTLDAYKSNQINLITFGLRLADFNASLAKCASDESVHDATGLAKALSDFSKAISHPLD